MAVTYQLSVTNNYAFDGVLPDGTRIPAKGGTWQSGTLGSTAITLGGLGAANFLDIADTKAGGFCQETWGVLISFQGSEAEFRYEGGGELSVTFNEFGQATLSSNGCISYPQLPAFTGE